MIRSLHIEEHHARRLLRMALISSPIIGLYTAIPFILFFTTLDLDEATLADFAPARFLAAMVGISVNILLFWMLFIYVIHGKHRLHATRWKYVVCYAVGIALVTVAISMMPPERVAIVGWFRLYPLMGMITNITVILALMYIVSSGIENARLKLDKQQLELSNLEAQLGLLKQQIQPHFLFNALTNLQAWVRREPEQAASYVGTLSSFLRASTRNQFHDTRPLREELQLAQDYLELQKMRFGQALHLTVEIAPDMLELELPTFALQLLVENALKHNGFGPTNPLNLSIYGSGDRIVVTNDLRPLPASARTEPSGIGLANLSERFQLMGLCAPKTQVEQDVYTVTLSLEPCP